MARGSLHRWRLRLLLALDADKLALAVAAFLAVVIMAVNFFVVRGEVLHALLRVFMTFAIAYALTFVFLSVMARVLWSEYRAMRRRERAEIAAAQRAAEEAEGAGANSAGENR